MKFSRLIVVAMLLVASPLFARDKSDVLVLNNGDHLTCEIKGLDKGVLYIGLDYVHGTVEVDWSKVSQVSSKQIFLVSTEDGRNYVGALSVAEGEASRMIRIEAVEDTINPVLVKQRAVVGMSQTSQNFWQRFSGDINSGFTFSKANETVQYSLGADAEYLRKSWSSGATFNSTLTSSTGVPTSTRNNVMMYYRHLMRWDKWFYMGIGTTLQSTEQNIRFQGTVGSGVGRYVANTNHVLINVFSGLAYQNTAYTQTGTRPPNENTAAAMLGVDASLFRFGKTKVTLDAVTIPALNQPGRVYNNVSATHYVKFWGNFTWNLSFYGNWDNQPPSTFSGSDYGVTSGLGWTFGNYNSYSK